MCVEIVNKDMNSTIEEFNQIKDSRKVSYSIKRLLKQFFKSAKKSQKQLINSQNLTNSQKADSLESLESLENLRNTDIEAECISLESSENDANEILSYEMEDFDFSDITSVPVHFFHTDHGTFFWTACNDVPADNDLIEPLSCITFNQIATSQMYDRWAQA